MSGISAGINLGEATTSLLHRPFGGLTGYRRATDRASRVSVEAFPIAMVAQLASAGLLATPAAYVLTDGKTAAYIGETKRPGRRIAEHSSDISKRSFATEVFVVAGLGGCPFEKSLALELQLRLTRRVIQAGAVSIVKGQNPAELDFADEDRSAHDRIFNDALRLLLDAGCRIFIEAVAPTARSEAYSDETDADSGPIAIGVTTTPIGAEEFELSYGDLWARAYWSDGHFIVAAGSEVRSSTNGSVNSITRTRREELFRSGVLSEIPGVSDRRRLTAAIAFPSTSIAAKCLCGAHTAGRWTPLSRSRAVILAA